MSSKKALLARIEKFLKRKDISASAFGTDALNDPSFVLDLRNGKRDLKLDTVDKVNAFMRNYRAKANA